MAEKTRIVDIPEGINVDVTANEITVKGPAAELTKQYPWQYISLDKADSKITIDATKNTAKLRAIVGTFSAHINNMIKGVQEPFNYKLKICSSHFPMTVKLQGAELHVSNFLGEKKPRKTKIPSNVKLNVEGDIIVIESNDKESAGQTAARIEQLTKIRNKDRRIFQDGIYIVEKTGKAVI